MGRFPRSQKILRALEACWENGPLKIWVLWNKSILLLIMKARCMYWVCSV